jgi:hypothetical protein
MENKYTQKTRPSSNKSHLCYKKLRSTALVVHTRHYSKINILRSLQYHNIPFTELE